MTNSIGLDPKSAKKIAKNLNELLADFQLFYINTRGLHWNIKGADFFEMHLKYEELYNDAQIKIDEIAERVLTLGGVPLHSFHDYLSKASIKPNTNVSKGNKGAAIVLNSLQTLIKKERAILELAGNANDEGTNALMSDYIREQEKLSWMFSSYLKQ